MDHNIEYMELCPYSPHAIDLEEYQKLVVRFKKKGGFGMHIQ